MNNTLRFSLIATGIFVAATVLLVAGFFIGRSSFGVTAPWANNTAQFSGRSLGMMGNIGQDQSVGFGSGMMGEPLPGGTDDFLPGQGMMGGTGFGMMMDNHPMMGTVGNSGLVGDIEPLAIETAQKTLDEYLVTLNNDDLEIGEIMIFNNHAYAQIVEKSTGIGALEVLVDPVSLAVYPEHGPNMMWNLKYGMMGGYGSMGSMMGRGMMGGMGYQNGQPGGMMGSLPAAEPTGEMPLSPEEAIERAQRFLDTYLPGSQADNHADLFYGYYTLHVLRDGKVTGMLSVNGYDGQVFPHTWHDEFIEMTGH